MSSNQIFLEQLRLFFPKGKTIDTYKKQNIKNVNQTLLNRPLKSLDSYTPKDAFINVFDEELFNILFQLAKIIYWQGNKIIKLQ